jgi:hypothetical protein
MLGCPGICCFYFYTGIPPFNGQYSTKLNTPYFILTQNLIFDELTNDSGINIIQTVPDPMTAMLMNSFL